MPGSVIFRYDKNSDFLKKLIQVLIFAHLPSNYFNFNLGVAYSAHLFSTGVLAEKSYNSTPFNYNFWIALQVLRNKQNLD